LREFAVRVTSRERTAVKIVFVLFRRTSLSHAQALAEWNGERYISIVRKISVVLRYRMATQTAVASVGWRED